MARRPRLSVVNHAPPPRDVTAGDNARAIEEGERVQFISFLSRLSAADDAVELARQPLKAAQKARSQIVGLAKGAGFSAKELERRLEEMRTPTRKMAELAEREHKQRRWAGILDADQAALILGDSAPMEAKDEAHWRGEGYKAGLRQMRAEPPTECPERLVQAWMHEHERGLNEVLVANAPRPLRSPAEQAAADYAEDNPDIDLDAEARKLKGSAFMERGGDEPFEATEEELAQQIGRGAPEDEAVV